MNKLYVSAVCLWLCLLSVSSQATLIEYKVMNLGQGRFEYEYTATNDTLQVAIEEFTIWFDESLYENLQITTQAPLANDWDEIILQETGLGVSIGYDSLTQDSGILPTEILNGFSVAFDWLGQNIPGPQFYEIVDPATYDTIDSGMTTPEPGTIALLALGGLPLLRRRGR